jgi:hypothetical protein
MRPLEIITPFVDLGFMKKMMMATKKFFKSILAIGHDDYEIYVLEKEMKPTYRSNHFSGQNSYSGAFSA